MGTVFERSYIEFIRQRLLMTLLMTLELTLTANDVRTVVLLKPFKLYLKYLFTILFVFSQTHDISLYGIYQHLITGRPFLQSRRENVMTSFSATELSQMIEEQLDAKISALKVAEERVRKKLILSLIIKIVAQLKMVNIYFIFQYLFLKSLFIFNHKFFKHLPDYHIEFETPSCN